MGRTERVNGGIAQRAGAKIVEPPPIVRNIKTIIASVIGTRVAVRNVILVPAAGRVGTHRSATQPEIPIQARWNRLLFRNLLDSLRPVRRAGVRMHLRDIANLARPDNLASRPMPLVRVALVSHLGRDLVLHCGFGQKARFPRSPSQWFLDIDVLTALPTGTVLRKA